MVRERRDLIDAVEALATARQVSAVHPITFRHIIVTETAPQPPTSR
jgi:hypothetical protein